MRARSAWTLSCACTQHDIGPICATPCGMELRLAALFLRLKHCRCTTLEQHGLAQIPGLSQAEPAQLGANNSGNCFSSRLCVTHQHFNVPSVVQFSSARVASKHFCTRALYCTSQIPRRARSRVSGAWDRARFVGAAGRALRTLASAPAMYPTYTHALMYSTPAFRQPTQGG